MVLNGFNRVPNSVNWSQPKFLNLETHLPGLALSDWYSLTLPRSNILIILRHLGPLSISWMVFKKLTRLWKHPINSISFKFTQCNINCNNCRFLPFRWMEPLNLTYRFGFKFCTRIGQQSIITLPDENHYLRLSLALRLSDEWMCHWPAVYYC